MNSIWSCWISRYENCTENREKFLEIFDQYNFRDFCLGYMFTNRYKIVYKKFNFDGFFPVKQNCCPNCCLFCICYLKLFSFLLNAFIMCMHLCITSGSALHCPWNLNKIVYPWVSSKNSAHLIYLFGQL